MVSLRNAGGWSDRLGLRHLLGEILRHCACSDFLISDALALFLYFAVHFVELEGGIDATGGQLGIHPALVVREL